MDHLAALLMANATAEKGSSWALPQDSDIGADGTTIAL
jgi:hypothetical protein